VLVADDLRGHHVRGCAFRRTFCCRGFSLGQVAWRNSRRARRSKDRGFFFAQKAKNADESKHETSPEKRHRRKKPSTSRACRGRFSSHRRCVSANTTRTHRNARNTTASTAPRPSNPVVGSEGGKGGERGRGFAARRDGARRRSSRS
jgi:hypothetical protein